MSPAQLAPTFVDTPVDGAPSQDVAHHAPLAPDPQIIARLANAFFQAPPASLASAPVPFGLPVTAPNLPDAPAPSLVTTAAPYAPARSPFGPPDLPPTTIPSVVPTPNIPAPAAPSTLQSTTRPLGLADVPQPGASVGSAGPSGLPTEIDYSAIPRFLGDATTLVPPAHAATPYTGYDPAAIPGGSAPARVDNLYFLHDRAPADARPAPTPSSSAPLTQSLPLVDSSHLAASTNAPEYSDAHPFHASPETFVISGPSEADPHRLSDAASLATPPGAHAISRGL